MAAGDVLNTAARLQSAAPVNGILVGEQTYRATERVIEYARARAGGREGKGGAGAGLGGPGRPLAPWSRRLAGERRAARRAGNGSGTCSSGTLRRVVAEREPQLVTLVGVPGIGKSRLVYELLGVVESDDELVYWRQGRCLPYGDGVAFWAFGEMVKAQAGILETDSSAETLRKLAEMVDDLCDEDAVWVERALRPLVGLGGDGTPGTRDESFAAWRRLVEAMADRRPTVLVFEDLHWADEGLLDFVDHLVDWSTGVPLLCVCTARPELSERRPDWGGGKLNSTTIALQALSEEETHALLAGLLGRSVLSAGATAVRRRQSALRRGVRADAGRPRPGRDGAARDGAGDHRRAARRALAGGEDGDPERSSVREGVLVGHRWPPSTAATPEALPLHSLVRKEFVRRERRSSVGGQDEYVFRHVLVRDVAYGQIPRAERAEKHLRAAEWIESLSERGEDLADLLAHHYVSALEYGAEGLGERAARALREAGDRSTELNSYVTRDPLLPRGARAADRRPPRGAWRDPVRARTGPLHRRVGRSRRARGVCGHPRGAEPGAGGGCAHVARHTSQAGPTPDVRALRAGAGARARPSSVQGESVRARNLWRTARSRPRTGPRARTDARGGRDRRRDRRRRGAGNRHSWRSETSTTWSARWSSPVESNFLVTAARCYGNFGDAWASHRRRSRTLLRAPGRGPASGQTDRRRAPAPLVHGRARG